jgi:SlyX protein
VSGEEVDTRVARLEERLAWFERHVIEQDKAMLELGDLVERLRREVLALRDRAGTSGGGGGGGPAGEAPEERPPHY